MAGFARLLMALGALLCADVAAAQSQRDPAAYPNRRLTLIVPFGAGGNGDITARVIGEALSARIGQPVVIENRPGSGGIIGMQTVARAAPDGYTLIVGSLSTHAMNPNLYPNYPVDPLADLETITITSRTSGGLLAARGGLNVKTPDELKELLKAKSTYTFSSPGVGSVGHLATLLFLKSIGARATHVPFPSSGASITQLLAGRIDFATDDADLLSEHVRSGAVSGLMVAGSDPRLQSMPGVPNAVEAGYPSVQAQTWAPWSVPKGTPQPVIQYLYDNIQAVLRDQKAMEPLTKRNVLMLDYTPEKSRQFIAAERQKWKEIIDAEGIKIQ